MLFLHDLTIRLYFLVVQLQHSAPEGLSSNDRRQGRLRTSLRAGHLGKLRDRRVAIVEHPLQMSKSIQARCQVALRLVHVQHTQLAVWMLLWCQLFHAEVVDRARRAVKVRGEAVREEEVQQQTPCVRLIVTTVRVGNRQEHHCRSFRVQQGVVVACIIEHLVLAEQRVNGEERSVTLRHTEDGSREKLSRRSSDDGISSKADHASLSCSHFRERRRDTLPVVDAKLNLEAVLIGHFLQALPSFRSILRVRRVQMHGRVFRQDPRSRRTHLVESRLRPHGDGDGLRGVHQTAPLVLLRWRVAKEQRELTKLFRERLGDGLTDRPRRTRLALLGQRLQQRSRRYKNDIRCVDGAHAAGIHARGLWSASCKATAVVRRTSPASPSWQVRRTQAA
jgi:hypothetical protein